MLPGRGGCFDVKSSHGCISQWSHKPDARRVAALWNMAHELGLSTEDIEAGCVQKLVEAALLVYDADTPRLQEDLDASLTPFTKPA